MKRKCIFLIILMGMITACGTDKASEKAVIPPKAVKQECLLQNINIQSCKTKTDNVACPKRTKLHH